GSWGSPVMSELDAEAEADLKVRVRARPDRSMSRVHRLVSIEHHGISEIDSKDHAVSDVALGHRAAVEDRVVQRRIARAKVTTAKMQQPRPDLDEGTPRAEFSSGFEPGDHLGFSKTASWVLREV